MIYINYADAERSCCRGCMIQIHEHQQANNQQTAKGTTTTMQQNNIQTTYVRYADVPVTDDMRAIIANTAMSKRGKIIALYNSGMQSRQISQLLNIRYQHASTTLSEYRKRTNGNPDNEERCPCCGRPLPATKTFGVMNAKVNDADDDIEETEI